MQPICRMPGCTDRAETTFALIPICDFHYEIIHDETMNYYTKHSQVPDKYARPQYRKIDALIPWSRKRMGKYA